jgi:DNA-binding transcriptional ArsR family regulator/uncharacterized protein YndB with AHSA1/START domain
LRDTDGIIRALNARTRRQILALIWERELSAGEIAAAFELTAPTISEHLATLRQARLVEMRPQGNSRLYRACPQALEGLHGALEGTAKWTRAARIPERELADVDTRPAVVAAVDVDVSQAEAFNAFTQPGLYSAWMGVPVHIDRHGGFSATMEWGTEIRGRYELTQPPHLIVMSWNFDDDNIPVPGQDMTGYLRVRPLTPNRAGVTVHQLVATDTQAEFMRAAWGLVLGRFKQGVREALNSTATARRRPKRPKL